MAPAPSPQALRGLDDRGRRRNENEMNGLLQIYLMRHGETAWSLSGQHTGDTDLPLTTRGEAMAIEAGLDPGVRPETVGVEGFVRAANIAARTRT